MSQDESTAGENLATSEEFVGGTRWGHPKGLSYLFFAELWERFSFYGMRALLTLYMVNEVFEALANRDAVSAIIYSSYGSLVYASPVIGGRIADKLLGYRRSIMLGGALMAIGHFVLAIENNITFYLALAFIIVGNGFFKPNISTFVGSLYKPGDNRKDSGFTIFYMGINIGAFVSPLLCGWLGENYGWHYGFGLAGIGMVAGLVVFWRGSKAGVFGDKGLPPTPEIIEKKKFGLPIKTLVPVISFLAVPVIAWLLSSYEYLLDGESFLGEVTIVNVLFYLIGISILLYLAYYIAMKAKKEERGKMVVAVLLTFFMTIFWGFHELSGSVLTLFASRNVDLSVLNASQTNSLNPVFIFLLAIPFSWIWIKLDQQKLNPRTPIKFALGLILLGIGFYVLALSRGSADGDGMVPMYYLVIMYVIISMGELCMSPVGLSKITDLSPVAIVAFMMGVWFLSSAYAFQIVGFIGKNLAIDGTESIGGLERLTIYTDGFEYISYFALGSGLFVLLISPLMRRWMRDVH